jgi:hypothetical protein
MVVTLEATRVAPQRRTVGVEYTSRVALRRMSGRVTHDGWHLAWTPPRCRYINCQ